MSVRRILIVAADDARALRARLVALGHEVFGPVPTVDETLALAARSEADLALVDCAAGADRTVVQAAGALRQLRALPLVVVTDADDAERLRLAGVREGDHHLATPFADRELQLTIELALCRHDAARTARELEDRFFALSIDLLCFLDFSGYFKRLNPAWERALGFSRRELMAQPFIEFVHPDDRERTLRQNAEVRAGGQALMFENRYRCRDGSYRWLRWNAASDLNERVIYSVARDVTEEKAAADEREQLVHELRAALAEVNALQEILPICSYCRKIRDDDDYWQTVESYLARHTSTRFSHGICPSCMETEVEPQLAKLERP